MRVFKYKLDHYFLTKHPFSILIFFILGNFKGDIKLFVLIRIFLLLLLTLSQAKAETKKDQSSTNYKKSEDFIPGEEVITPTGKTVKVWSTKGPVKVSPVPEPFADQEKTRLKGDAHIIIDEESFRSKPSPSPVR